MATERFLVLGDTVVHLHTGAVTRRDGGAQLSPMELAVLTHLAERRGESVSRDELMQEVWGYQEGVKTRTVDITVGRLRRKLSGNGDGPPLISTVYGHGYRLDGPTGGGSAAKWVPAPARVSGAPAAVRQWFGEASTLDALADELRARHRVVVLGPIGAGKTRAVIEAVARLERPAVRWIRFDDGREAGALMATLVRELQLSADSLGGLVAAFAALPSDQLVVLDALPALDDDGKRLLERLCAARTGPGLVMTTRRDPRLRAARVFRVAGLCERHLEALFRDELRVHAPQVDAASACVERWVLAADGLPGAVIHLAQQVHSRNQLDAGPATASLRPFETDAAATLALLSVGTRALAAQLASFPDGLTWAELQQMWPDEVHGAGALVGEGLALEDVEGRVRIANRLAPALPRATGSQKLVQWALAWQPRGRRSCRHNRNLEAAVGAATELSARRHITLTYLRELERCGELSAAHALLSSQLDGPCPQAFHCGRLHVERGLLELMQGRPRHAADDFRSSQRLLAPDSAWSTLARVGGAYARVAMGAPAPEDAGVWEDEVADGLLDEVALEVVHLQARGALRGGQGARVVELCERALRRIEEDESPAHQVRFRITLAVGHMITGGAPAAFTSLEEAIRLAELHGLAMLEGLARSGLGAMLLERDEPHEALEVLQRAVQSVGSARSYQVLVLGNIGLAKMILGDLAGARQDLLVAQGIGERAGARAMLGLIRGLLGLQAHLGGDVERAARDYDAGLAQLAGRDARAEQMVRAFRALAAAQLGQPVDGSWSPASAGPPGCPVATLTQAVARGLRGEPIDPGPFLVGLASRVQRSSAVKTGR